MQIDNYSLKNCNTFGIEAKAAHFYEYTHVNQLVNFLQSDFNFKKPFFVLGGGSNVLFTKDFEGTIIHPNNKGIRVIEEQENSVFVEVAAGEIWDDFVAWAVANNLYGAENLSHIPGCVGASPVQNIGAYGKEAADIISQVFTIEIASKQNYCFSKLECEFGYRTSVFKTHKANKYIVTSVIFELQKQRNFSIEYGSIKSEIEKLGEINLENVRNTIIAIREQKLPNPAEIGNAGSFFKNPIVNSDKLQELLKTYPNMVTYPISDNEVKIAAGWLIENLGFKGFELGKAKVHDKQALVITNMGGATGNEIVNLARKIQQTIYEKTGITIEPEVIFL